MAIEIVSEYTPEVANAINTLLPQLSSSASPLSEKELQEFISQKGVFLFMYRIDDTQEIAGMLTLATFALPTGIRAWIEDVVVAQSARGKGAGQKIVEAAVAYAEKMGCRTVDITSRPSREAANRLYKRCGFNLRETNVYRFSGK